MVDPFVDSLSQTVNLLTIGPSGLPMHLFTIPHNELILGEDESMDVGFDSDLTKEKEWQEHEEYQGDEAQQEDDAENDAEFIPDGTFPANLYN